MKLVITIDVDSSDMEESDVDKLIKESTREGASVHVEIGSSLSEEEPDVIRYVSVGSEYFTVRKEE